MEDKKYSKKKSLSKREVKFLTKIYDTYNEQEILEGVQEEVLSKLGYYEYKKFVDENKQKNYELLIQEEKESYPIDSLFLGVICRYRPSGIRVRQYEKIDHYNDDFVIIRRLDLTTEKKLIDKAEKNGYYSWKVENDKFYEVVSTKEIVEMPGDYIDDPRPFRTLNRNVLEPLNRAFNFHDKNKRLITVNEIKQLETNANANMEK